MRASAHEFGVSFADVFRLACRCEFSVNVAGIGSRKVGTRALTKTGFKCTTPYYNESMWQSMIIISLATIPNPRKIKIKISSPTLTGVKPSNGSFQIHMTQSVKAVLVGDTCVGKTAIFRRFECDSFTNDHVSTVGGAFTRISVEGEDQKVIHIGLWDTAGQEKYRNIVPMYFQRANIIMVVYDISARDTFDNITTWLELARDKAPKEARVIIIGNKSDLEESRAITLAELHERKAAVNAFAAVETSALSGDGIDVLGNELAKMTMIPQEIDTAVVAGPVTNKETVFPCC